MSFKTWLESDEEHGKALRQTGFWGRQGAGSIVLCSSSGRLLIPHRSANVQEPNTWGVWGGAIDSDEDPMEAAKRELQEEAGYNGPISMIQLSVFQSGSFKYHNFLAVVDEEFKPKLNWETQGYVWADLDKMPQPLHFGLEWLLSKDRQKIRGEIESRLPSANLKAGLDQAAVQIARKPA